MFLLCGEISEFHKWQPLRLDPQWQVQPDAKPRKNFKQEINAWISYRGQVLQASIYINIVNVVGEGVEEVTIDELDDISKGSRLSKFIVIFEACSSMSSKKSIIVGLTLSFTPTRARWKWCKLGQWPKYVLGATT